MIRTRSLVVSLIMVFFLVHPGWADFSAYPELKKVDDFIYQVLEKLAARVQDFKVGAPVEGGGKKIFPVELSFTMCEPEILPRVLKKMVSVGGKNIALRPFSLAISVTAESRSTDRKSIVMCSLLLRVYQGPEVDQTPENLNPEVIAGWLENIKFEPGVQAKSKMDGVSRWLTNLRVSDDPGTRNSLSVSGYSFEFDEVLGLAGKLSDNFPGANVQLYSMNANTYSGFRVWRFDGSMMEKASFRLDKAFLEGIRHISDTCISEGAGFSAIRISPPVRQDNFMEIPLEISFKEAADWAWEPIKKKLSGATGKGWEIKKVSGLSTDSQYHEQNARISLGLK